MNMAFSVVVWKYGLLAANIFISLMAVAIISCGVVALGGAGSTSGAYIIAMIGFTILAVCFIGCCAALRESYLLSMVFLGTTLTGIVLQIIFLIVFAAMKDDLMESTSRRILDLWDKEAIQPGSMDGVQMQYYCCGKDSPQDYLLDEDDILPRSCCILGDCSKDANIYTKGCASNAINVFDDLSDDLILSLVGLVALELWGLVSAYYLARSVKHVVHKTEQIVISE